MQPVLGRMEGGTSRNQPVHSAESSQEKTSLLPRALQIVSFRQPRSPYRLPLGVPLERRPQHLQQLHHLGGGVSEIGRRSPHPQSKSRTPGLGRVKYPRADTHLYSDVPSYDVQNVRHNPTQQHRQPIPGQRTEAHGGAVQMPPASSSGPFVTFAPRRPQFVSWSCTQNPRSLEEYLMHSWAGDRGDGRCWVPVNLISASSTGVSFYLRRHSSAVIRCVA